MFTIINYSNLALQVFDNRISRNDASSMPIYVSFKEFDTPMLRNLFEEFCKAWEQFYQDFIDSDVYFRCNKLTIKK